MCIIANARNSVFLRFNQGRSGTAEWIKQQVARADGKSRHVLTDEVRWIRKNETVPIVNSRIFLLERIDAAIPGANRLNGRLLHFSLGIVQFSVSNATPLLREVERPRGRVSGFWICFAHMFERFFRCRPGIALELCLLHFSYLQNSNPCGSAPFRFALNPRYPYYYA